jgi:hypothetical protein
MSCAVPFLGIHKSNFGYTLDTGMVCLNSSFFFIELAVQIMKFILKGVLFVAALKILLEHYMFYF